MLNKSIELRFASWNGVLRVFYLGLAIVAALLALMQAGPERMLDEVMSRFKEQSVSEVTLWVIESNRRARRFYEIAGFKPDGLKKNEVKLGTSLVLVRYVRELRKLS